MKNPKTRIAVGFEGFLYELLSVEVTKDGSVLLFPKLTSRVNGKDVGFKQCKHSIHPTNSSNDGGFNVVTTYQEIGKEPDKQHCYVKPLEHHKNIVVGAHAPGRLNVTVNKLSPRGNDNIILLCNVPFPEVLTYLIVVSKSGLTIDQFNSLNLNYKELQIEGFVIYILYGFFSLPPSLSSISHLRWTINPDSLEFKQRNPGDQIIATSYFPHHIDCGILESLHGISDGLFTKSFSEPFVTQTNITKKEGFLTKYRENCSFFFSKFS